MDIRKFGEEQVRVESGPIQFGEDWPGVFFRGDYAGPLSMYLGLILTHLEKDPDLYKRIDVFTLGAVRGLQKDLASCMLNCERK